MGHITVHISPALSSYLRLLAWLSLQLAWKSSYDALSPSWWPLSMYKRSICVVARNVVKEFTFFPHTSLATFVLISWVNRLRCGRRLCFATLNSVFVFRSVVSSFFHSWLRTIAFASFTFFVRFDILLFTSRLVQLPYRIIHFLF